MLWHYAVIAWGCSVAAACSGVQLWLGEHAHDNGVSHLSQGSVGSCWAFSACGVLEGAWFLATHNLTSLGPEFLVDCDDKDCGVFGGWPYLALEVRDHCFVCVFFFSVSCHCLCGARVGGVAAASCTSCTRVIVM